MSQYENGNVEAGEKHPEYRLQRFLEFLPDLYEDAQTACSVKTAHGRITKPDHVPFITRLVVVCDYIKKHFVTLEMDSEVIVSFLGVGAYRYKLMHLFDRLPQFIAVALNVLLISELSVNSQGVDSVGWIYHTCLSNLCAEESMVQS